MEFAFLSPSPMEMAVIAVIALLVLGPSRLPEAARSLGKGMKEMRDSFSGAMDSDDDDRRLADHDDDEDEDEDLDDDEDLFAPGDEVDEDAEPTSDTDDADDESEPAVKTA